MVYRTKECGALKSVLTSLAEGLLILPAEKIIALTDDCLKLKNKKRSKNLNLHTLYIRYSPKPYLSLQVSTNRLITNRLETA